MGILTPPLAATVSHSKSTQHSFSILERSNSMSQDYHQGIFSFSNGFERSPITPQEHHHHQQQQHQQHIPQQIRRDKARLQGFEGAPPPLVGIEEEESGGLPVYETTGMLSEMFNFPSAGATAVELLDPTAAANYRAARPQPPSTGIGQESWYGNKYVISGFGPLQGEAKGQNASTVMGRDRSMAQQQHHQIPGINADSAAAMQLFLMNPQTRSPSPPPHHNHGTNAPATSTLHMLLPHPSSTPLQGYAGAPSSAGGGAFGQFTWVPDSGHEGNTSSAQLNNTPAEIGRIVEGQGLSLSLSSSLQHLEGAKAEELRMGDSGLLYYNQGPGGTSSAPQYPYKNLASHNPQPLHLQGPAVTPNHQVHVGFGSSLGVVNVLRNSKYIKAAQELLEEFCSIGRGQFKKNRLGRQHSNPNSNPGASSGGKSGPSTSSKDVPPLSAADRIEHQRRKVKLLAMLDEVDRRYNHYCEQMQMVVNSFDMVMGFGSAVPYTALAQKAMSRHFRCLKDAITAQLKHSCEHLGEKDGAGTSGLTKGETPRLKLLEQSLRQQRAFHQMGMMEQEAWRPQRGLPERSVNILRAWLFEHFLHPYPSDADKHLLARQTGLSRNQVSNWFINARVRLWKPMVEEMYQQEAKDREEGTDEDTQKNLSSNNTSSGFAQTPTSSTTATTQAARTATTQPLSTTAIIQPTTTASTTAPTGKRSDINASESDPSLVAINTQCFSENQAKHQPSSSISPATIMVHTNNSEAVPPVSQCFATLHDSELQTAADNTFRLGSMASNDYGDAPGGADVGSTLIRFGTTPGDVSLTLGLRHAGNTPEKSSAFSMRDFGGI